MDEETMDEETMDERRRSAIDSSRPSAIGHRLFSAIGHRPSPVGSFSPTQLAPFQRLDIYVAARELVVVVVRAKIRDAELRDQVTRAAESVLLRLSEGLPHRSPGMRRNYFAQALGSVYEVAAGVDVADALGVIEPGHAADAAQLATRVRLMLGRLR